MLNNHLGDADVQQGKNHGGFQNAMWSALTRILLETPPTGSSDMHWPLECDGCPECQESQAVVAGMVLMALKTHMSTSILDCPLRRNYLGRSGPRLGFGAQAAVGAEKGVSDFIVQATTKGPEPAGRLIGICLVGMEWTNTSGSG